MYGEQIDIDRLLDAATDKDFDEALKDEMDDHWSLLPLEDFCLDGGSPECDVAISNVKKIRDDEEELVATFNVTFTEEIGSGCSDMPIERSRYGYCRVTIDKKNRHADVSADEDHRQPEF